jgi:hypothetical protein
VDGACQHGDRPSGFAKDEEFFYQLSNCILMKVVRTLDFKKSNSAVLLLQSYFTENIISLPASSVDQTKSEFLFVSYALNMNNTSFLL